MKYFLAVLRWFLWKEIAIEIRRKERFLSMLVFSVGVIFLFHFSLPVIPAEKEAIVAGIIWVTLALSGILGLNRSMAIDLEDGHTDAILQAPVDRTAFFLAKVLSNACLMLLTSAVLFPMIRLFLGVPIFYATFFLVVLLGILGYSIVGSILAGMSMQTRMRDTMLSVLLFPVLIPLLVAAVKASAGIFSGAELQTITPWVQFVGVYDVIFFAVGIMIYPAVIEE